ncbi:MAG: cytochrome c3 family protein [Gemmatimonadota bacterium]
MTRSRAATNRARWGAASLVLALAGAAGLTLAKATPAAEPVTFPHRHHVEVEELSCGDCHATAVESRASDDNLLPDPAVCKDCHEEGEVPTTWPAREREILFSHQRHAGTLALECQSCHAGVLAEPLAAALPAMDRCMACHTGVQAPRDCEACHLVELAALVPASHGAGWRDSHGQQARISDAACVPCHAVSDCQECHEGALLVELAALGVPRQTPFGPELAGRAGQTLQRVHGLNYRFLHALDARGKSSDCITCHELDTGDFCGECHNPAGDAGLRPVWHGGANWGALAGAVGSGGGRHAELARRDIERCAACHESQGDDPACLLCHMDRAPGKGNDPRTHGRDFADDAGHGDFHNDPDALCYACHRQETRAGDGFCGYCHGPK